MVNDELRMYADLILEALEECHSVVMKLSKEVLNDTWTSSKDGKLEARDIEVAHVTTTDGITVANWILDDPMDALEVLVYMIHTGDNFNYRMEGNMDDLDKDGCVVFHIKHVGH